MMTATIKVPLGRAGGLLTFGQSAIHSWVPAPHILLLNPEPAATSSLPAPESRKKPLQASGRAWWNPQHRDESERTSLRGPAPAAYP